MLAFCSNSVRSKCYILETSDTTTHGPHGFGVEVFEIYVPYHPRVNSKNKDVPAVDLTFIE